MYCVRCGDKIDKNETICDKCGLHFTVLQENGTLVYINQSPRPINQETAKKPKKKKKGKGCLISLFAVLGTMAVGALAVLVLAVGIFVGLVGLVMLIPDEDPVVVNTTAVDNSNHQIELGTNTVTYENGIAYTENDQLSDALRDPFVNLKGDGTDTVTVMIYMNGSDLESNNGCATADLKEMLNAQLSDNVNVVIQTGGTKKWKTKGISSKHSQRFIVKEGQLILVDDSLAQLDITDENTLEGFIRYCANNYPADRNMLILWDHGGGVVYGYGVDENVDDEYAALTIAEIQRATRNSGVKFEMIGFDACLMGGLETVCALSDSADYLVVSEDFESGDGWEYQNWLTLLGYNSSTPMNEVGKLIVDDFIKESYAADSNGILAVVDLRYSRLLFNTWTNFAYANESELLEYDYTMSMQRSSRAPEYLFDGSRTSDESDKDIFDWFFDSSDTMETYCYAVDLMAIAGKMNTDESQALEAAMKRAIVYCSTTTEDSYMTGLSVTLPYGEQDFYDELETVFKECGFDNNYITFLSKFVSSDYDSYDWDTDSLTGWGDYDDSYNDDWYDYDWNDYDWEDYSNSDYEWDDSDYSDWIDWLFDDSSYYDDGYYYDDSSYDDGSCDYNTSDDDYWW